MRYYTILPPPDLAAYIRCFWVLEHEVSACKPYFHKTMADGCAELIFHYQGRFDEIAQSGDSALSFTAGLSGPSSQFRRFRIGGSFGIFGVYLFPYALPAMFAIPASELVNEMPDLHSLLGKKGSELEEQMMLAEIAYEAGYYDQSHFIHEFKAFSGEHPGSYFSGNSEATEYRDV